MKYRITLAYDGTDYFGWQMQLNQPTIQSVFSAALEKLEGEPVATFAAGRTDAGVHAEGQVVSFHLSKKWPPGTLVNALNGNLPPDIRAIDAQPAHDNFHARASAIGKTYRYQLYNADIMSPFLNRFAWHYPQPLDVDRMKEDSRSLVGKHDFTGFTVSDCEVKTRIREISEIKIERHGDLMTLTFTGDGFLRYQVRTMVTALIESNRRRLKCGSISELVERKDRSLVGAPAPAKGLTLMKVEY